MTDQIGLIKFKLSQRRYEGGEFYISAIRSAGELKALDGRFILQNGNALTPTKNGFRIPLEKLSGLNHILAGDHREIGDQLLFENKSFRFHVRYVNDKYGEGIDFRKFKTTDKYTGWDRSGIRMKLEDVTELRDSLRKLNPDEICAVQDLFAGKDFGRSAAAEKNEAAGDDVAVNPDIEKLLNF